VRRLPGGAVAPLFTAGRTQELGKDTEVSLPPMLLGEHVAADYQTMRLSLKAHPMQILRPIYDAERILSCKATTDQRDGAWARTAGVVLVRQRPGNGKAIFVTLEDETGVANVVLWARTFETFRFEVMGARLMLVEGRVQKSVEGVTHLMGVRVFDRSGDLARLSEEGAPDLPPVRSDQYPAPGAGDQYPGSRHRHPRDVRVLPKSRDFH
jgi:error-prone DNA polymerase